MNGRRISILSFPVVAALLAALVLALLVLGRAWGLGPITFYLLAIPVALAIAYLAWYRTLPYEPSPRRVGVGATPVAATADDEPFEDPDEEPDLLDRESSAPTDELGADETSEEVAAEKDENDESPTS